MRSDLSPARKQLLEIIGSLGFGVIDDLMVVNGEPCFDPPPKILEDIKIGCADPEGRQAAGDRNFALKSRVIELFDHLDRIGSAKIKIEVKHSTAFRIVVERELGVADGSRRT